MKKGKRITKTKVYLDAECVKNIAEMQWKYDQLENAVWRIAMMTRGLDDGNSIAKFTDDGSLAEAGIDIIFDFVKEKITTSNKN